MRQTRIGRSRSVAALLAALGLSASLATGCQTAPFGSRHFAGPIVPGPTPSPAYTVGDDRSVTFEQNRLHVRLQPLTVEMLDRQFGGAGPQQAGYVNPLAGKANPFTYSGWTPPGRQESPSRFTVFHLEVKNYAYPKVLVDAARIRIETGNGRTYPSLSQLALLEYYWPYAVAYAGNTYLAYRERSDVLRNSLYPTEFVFSGQEESGYVVFGPLHRDVDELTVVVEQVMVRFDYRDQAVETLDLAFSFARDTYVARAPREHADRAR